MSHTGWFQGVYSGSRKDVAHAFIVENLYSAPSHTQKSLCKVLTGAVFSGKIALDVRGEQFIKCVECSKLAKDKDPQDAALVDRIFANQPHRVITRNALVKLRVTAEELARFHDVADDRQEGLSDTIRHVMGELWRELDARRRLSVSANAKSFDAKSPPGVTSGGIEYFKERAGIDADSVRVLKLIYENPSQNFGFLFERDVVQTHGGTMTFVEWKKRTALEIRRSMKNGVKKSLTKLVDNAYITTAAPDGSPQTVGAPTLADLRQRFIWLEGHDYTFDILPLGQLVLREWKKIK